MSDEREKQIQLIKKNVAEYPDFPKPGVLFRDVFSVLRKPELFSMLHNILLDMANEVKGIDCIAGLDSRGFLFAPLIALDMKLPFVPIRKKGKLPGKIISHTYKLEYGEDTLQIQESALGKGQKVLLVDDLLATGGSLKASCELISQLGAEVICSLVCMELCELNGRQNLPCSVLSVLKF